MSHQPVTHIAQLLPNLGSDGAPDRPAGRSAAPSGWLISVDGQQALLAGPSVAAAPGEIHLIQWGREGAVSKVSTLSIPDPELNGQTCSSLLLRGGMAYLGCSEYGGQPDLEGAGAVLVFDVSDPDEPELKALVQASDAQPGQCFGWDLALDGDLLLVGAPGDGEQGKGCGSAYLYDLSDPLLPTETKLQVSDPEPMGILGRSVAISGGLAVL